MRLGVGFFLTNAAAQEKHHNGVSNETAAELMKSTHLCTDDRSRVIKSAMLYVDVFLFCVCFLLYCF